MKMNKKRTIAITLALLITASAFGTLSVSAASPPKLTQLTCLTTNANPVADQKFTIYGRLMNGTASVQGQTITLTYWDGTNWNPLGTCVTSHYGGYSYTMTLPLLSYQTPQPYAIKAEFAGTPSYAASSSEVWVTVNPADTSISIYTTVAEAVTGQPFSIYGWVTHAKTGARLPNYPVEIYLYWIEAGFGLGGATQTNDVGFYRVGPGNFYSTGHFIIYAYAANSFSYLESPWNSVALTVSPANTKLSIFSGTASPAAYKPFTIYGLLQNTLTKERIANEPGLTLSYSADGGATWNTLPGSVSTDARGQYAFSLKLPAGTYLIQVNFPGQSNYYFPGELIYYPSNSPLPWTITVV